MSVTVVKGRSGSGKSRFLMTHIRCLIQDPFAKIIVIVPGQLTFETEKKIMQSCGVDGIFGLQVVSIQRLACKILEDTKQCTFLTNAQKAIACHKALQAQGNPFGGMDQLSDFDTCIVELMSRLKSYNQTPESLRNTANSATDTALSKKLCDTADLYEQYIEICKGKPDASDMYAIAAANAENAVFLKDAHVVIDGLDSYSPAVMTLLSKVMGISKDTMAAFRSEGNGCDADLFTSEGRDIERFIAAATKSGKQVAQKTTHDMTPRYTCEELKFLETNLYKYPYSQFEGQVENIRLFAAESIEQEIDILATNILAEIKKGRRFRDIAVVGGGVDGYLSTIKTKFALCGIPYFMDERRSLADNTFFSFLQYALSAAAGDVTAVTGYVYSNYAPLTGEQKVALRKYAGRYALKGWHYMTEFWRGIDAKQMEVLRKKALSPLLVLTEGIKENSAEKQIDAIKQFLKMCKTEDKLTAFCDSINDGQTPSEYEYFKQVYAKCDEALSGMEQVYGDTQIPLNAVCSLVKTSFSSTKIAVIPPTTDEMGIYDISVARLPDIDVLFAIGVHDGVWPAKDGQPGILSSDERNTLFDMGVDIGVFDLAAEKLKIYTALVKPKQRLYLSYNTQCGQPSILIDRFKRIFTTLSAEKQTVENTSMQGMQGCVLGEMSDVLNGSQPSDVLIKVCSRFLKQQGWQEQVSGMLLRTNTAKPITQEIAVKLYGGIRCSATRIEGYYQCPFRHFLDRGIKVQFERDYTNDKLDIGTYMHLALDMFAKSLLDDEVDIKTLSPAEVGQRMKAAAHEAAELHDNGKLLNDERFRLQYGLLVKELLNTAQRIRKHFEGTDANIYASEQEFTDYTVSTVFGDVVITGKIDRIDVAGNHFRVVDYKSSANNFDIQDFAAGVALQLPIYIQAAGKLLEKSGTDLSVSGGYYMKIGDMYKDSGEAVEKAARMAGISLQNEKVLLEFNAVLPDGSLRTINQALTKSGTLHGRGKNQFFTEDELEALLDCTNDMIQNAAEGMYCGNIAIEPKDNTACTYCDYKSVCMFHDEYDGNETRTLEPFDKALLTREICDE